MMDGPGQENLGRWGVGQCSSLFFQKAHNLYVNTYLQTDLGGKWDADLIPLTMGILTLSAHLLQLFPFQL